LLYRPSTKDNLPGWRQLFLHSLKAPLYFSPPVFFNHLTPPPPPPQISFHLWLQVSTVPSFPAKFSEFFPDSSLPLFSFEARCPVFFAEQGEVSLSFSCYFQEFGLLPYTTSPFLIFFARLDPHYASSPQFCLVFC